MSSSVAAAVISLVAVAVPLAASYFSGNRHMRELRDISWTMESLPEGHAARGQLDGAIGEVLKDYTGWRGRRARRRLMRLGLMLLLAALALVQAREALRGNSGFGQSERDGLARTLGLYVWGLIVLGGLTALLVAADLFLEIRGTFKSSKKAKG